MGKRRDWDEEAPFGLVVKKVSVGSNEVDKGHTAGINLRSSLSFGNNKKKETKLVTSKGKVQKIRKKKGAFIRRSRGPSGAR